MKMPDLDERTTPTDDDLEEEAAWDCDRDAPEWTDGDDARVEREGY